MDLLGTSRIPRGQLGIISLASCRELGEKIDFHLVEKREKGRYDIYPNDPKTTYLISTKEARFSNGEGKVSLRETVRGKDVYILADVGNYGCTYEMYGIETHMGPDEHFQDIKRAISAIAGKSRRLTVVMPLLYASRQHKRKGRESLDCAMALQELERLGVDNIITFDAHDPRIENAVSRTGFDSLHCTFQIIKALIENEDELTFENGNSLVISPDTGGMDRAIYYSSLLGIDVGMFYKRRDHTRIVNGKNPIISHEYLGADVAGKDVLIVDDMIASGESIIDLAEQLKKRNARNIYVAVSFSLFTEGIEKFNKCYADGLIKRLYSTNLTYVPEEIKAMPWYTQVDMSEFMALLIDKLNYDESIAPLLDMTKSTKELINKKQGKI